jgi:hypothetical protein
VCFAGRRVRATRRSDQTTHSANEREKRHEISKASLDGARRDRRAAAGARLVTINATLASSDVCDTTPTIRLVSITSNEPDNGLGDGDQPNDIQGAAFGTDDRQFLLRSERAGKKKDRSYTITYSATDDSNNTTQRQATVRVPAL